ncbi:hypothetical protein LTR95_001621 [Oleoguttula sp. CCFEE 5521]|uniref:NADH-ubiquinone oxidoreductase B12 subunit n=1 Tax=Cryoendolithus antarcticus TaxID=1507870 RepID=A0A1V8SW87_9PEZI|nr:hypothetical protein B0A48_10079 [Cryoendolithus antarcticus]OQO29214.1 hypothetical protein B0A51_03846 [Rachicladosporium sp. CCFEE 5018]
MAPRSNLTGFDPAKFAAAAGQPANDPWARAEAWRYTGPFTRSNRLRGSFPGFGIALGAFAVYVAYDKLIAGDSHAHHGAEHGHAT